MRLKFIFILFLTIACAGSSRAYGYTARPLYTSSFRTDSVRHVSLSFRGSSSYSSPIAYSGSGYHTNYMPSLSVSHSLPSMTSRTTATGQFKAAQVVVTSNGVSSRPRRVGEDDHPDDPMWQPVGDTPFALLLLFSLLYIGIRTLRKRVR